MEQKPIRPYDGQEYTIEEAAEWLQELDDRTSSDNEGYNSIEELSTKLKLLEEKVNELSPVEITTYYVRPTGTTYGDGSGESYENAWGGFSNVDWQLLEGKTLAICGNHRETLTVGIGNVNIIGNDENEAGVIDGENLLESCLIVNNFNNVVINSLEIMNATASNFNFYGNSEGETNNCISHGSGNQGMQHDDTANWTHNNLESYDNVDDGVSLHNDSTVVLNSPYLHDNFQGLNSIQNGNCTVNGGIFENNTEDIRSSENCTFEINNSITNNNIFAFSSNTLIFNFHTFSSGQITIGTSCDISESKITGDTNILNDGDVRIERSYISSNTSYRIRNRNDANCVVTYSIFNISSGQYGIFQESSNKAFVYNCLFFGFGTGRCILFSTQIDVYNSIFDDCTFAYQNPGGTGVLEDFNCNLYNTGTNGGNITRNNAITGNPLIADYQNLDFSLQVGSPCIGSGVTTSNTTGIDTADWNLEPPTVAKKEQTAPFDVGAYVS